MFSIEKKLVDWMEQHILVLASVVVTLLSMYIRYDLREYVSTDAYCFLLPWYDEIKTSGGFAGLGHQVGNYNILYQTLIAFFTYIPIKPLYAYKILSIIFDYLLGLEVAYLVYINTEKNRLKCFVSYVITIMLPMTCLNSSFWAQCDSIYTFWGVLALILYCRDKHRLSFVALGIALAFKLQAIFFLPFFLFVYIYKKKFSILNFLIIPAVMIVSGLGGLIQGRGIKEIFKVYLEQSNQYHNLSLNYASIWSLVHETDTQIIYDILKPMTIVITLIILGIYMLIIVCQKKNYSQQFCIEFAFLLAYTCVMFLPGMHERYDYAYVILGIVLIMFNTRFVPAFIGIVIINLRMYSIFLFGAPSAEEIIIFINIICYVSFAILIMKESFNLKGIEESKDCI